MAAALSAATSSAPSFEPLHGQVNGVGGGNQDLNGPAQYAPFVSVAPAAASPLPSTANQSVSDDQRISAIVTNICQQSQRELIARLAEQERTNAALKSALISLSSEVKDISDFLEEASARYNGEGNGGSGRGGHGRRDYDEDGEDDDEGAVDDDEDDEEENVDTQKKASKSGRRSAKPKSSLSRGNGSRGSKGDAQNAGSSTPRDDVGDKKRKSAIKKADASNGGDKKSRQAGDKGSAASPLTGKRTSGDQKTAPVNVAASSKKGKDNGGSDKRRRHSRDSRRHSRGGSGGRRRHHSSSDDSVSSGGSSYDSSHSSDDYSSESASSSEDDRRHKKRGGGGNGGRDKRNKGTKPVRFEEGPLD